MILADDLRPDCIGALGNPHIRTPHLDRLVKRGARSETALLWGATGRPSAPPAG